MKKPLFSIATPCWNSESTIERTIKSVLRQDFKDYEYIIVDGGSTDSTLDIIKKYEPLFEGRMQWKSEPDKGLYDAFNKGVERSVGIYCWNVNADDFLEPRALHNLSEFIKSKSWDKLPIISGCMNFVTTEGKLQSILRPKESELELGFKNDYIGIPHPATLVPKEVYDKHGAFDTYYKIIGDADWFHRVYAAGETFSFVDFVITNMSDGGISNLFIYRKSLRDRIHFLKKFYGNPFTRFIHWAKWTRSFYMQKRNHLRNKANNEK
ncbi:PGL/p-HBAD biosynthesis glycosyltransferase [Bacteroides salyersiae]|uniref:glycosyltransferase family 2 protein n=1 Tax=Bacteroides salyersiae TaxID=291644 RepID=UPI001B8D1BAC|nr:glycosyltransferase family 2 protein [Bacteroides salyersiae]QUT76683.1 PGL/p-HBAD biosynthesis glycosyltransferase [Bacteroides salyersiae]UBD14938.1 glycosyltransferase [Bacteroides salyersiae]